jgi:hypothetical protein
MLCPYKGWGESAPATAGGASFSDSPAPTGSGQATAGKRYNYFYACSVFAMTKDAGLPDPDQRRRGKRQRLGPPVKATGTQKARPTSRGKARRYKNQAKMFAIGFFFALLGLPCLAQDAAW